MLSSTLKTAIWLLITLLVTASAGCSGKPDLRPAKAPVIQPAPSVNIPAASQYAGDAALKVARNMIGVSYRYGGTDPRGFDCSGLVQYSFKQAGVKLPRTSQDIFRSSQRVKPSEMQPGDLVFFRISSNKVSHVGIYAGDRRFIHSPSSGKGVSYASLDNSYWRKRLVGVGRI